jgi:hypothetical protein
MPTSRSVSLKVLDTCSVEELIEQTTDEDKYVVEVFLKKLEKLTDRYIDIRREELGSPEPEYSLEVVRVNGDVLTAKYSNDGGCSCGSDCGYKYKVYDINMSHLLLSEEKIRENFSAEKEKILERQLQQIKTQIEKEERERQEKEMTEKALLEQLKKKYEGNR